MDICFDGKVCDGVGRFSKEIKIPSPIKELSNLGNWPATLVPGTFNVQVPASGWPEVEGLDFRSRGVRCLDRANNFPPACYLDYAVVPNNTLNPTNKGEYGGDLQFWRAILQVGDVGESVYCYMLRRVKSGYMDRIELVADIHIRNTYKLANGHPIKLTIYTGAS